MSKIEISVTSLGLGWIVEANRFLQPLAFFSGGRAEAYARQLAIASAQAGHHTYLTVKDARGRIVGKRFYGASANVVGPHAVPRAA